MRAYIGSALDGKKLQFDFAFGVLLLRSGRRQGSDKTMQDVWMVMFTAVFFALAFAYVQACQRLR